MDWVLPNVVAVALGGWNPFATCWKLGCGFIVWEIPNGVGAAASLGWAFAEWSLERLGFGVDADALDLVLAVDDELFSVEFLSGVLFSSSFDSKLDRLDGSSTGAMYWNWAAGFGAPTYG